MNKNDSCHNFGNEPVPSGLGNRWPRRFVCRECGREVTATTAYPKEVWQGPKRWIVWTLRRHNRPDGLPCENTRSVALPTVGVLFSDRVRLRLGVRIKTERVQ